MGISSINPFAIGNIERGYGASTYTPVKSPVQNVNTAAQSQGFKGFASIDDIEKASQFLQGNIDFSSSKVNKSTKARSIDARGTAWEGFKVPANNGTGELIPQFAESEKICDYMA